MGAQVAVATSLSFEFWLLYKSAFTIPRSVNVAVQTAALSSLTILFDVELSCVTW